MHFRTDNKIQKTVTLLISIAIALVSCAAILLFKFYGPLAVKDTVTSSAEDDMSLTTASFEESSALNTEVSSIVSSAVSSAASSTASSKAASSSKAAAPKKVTAKPKAVVPTNTQLKAAAKKIPTKAQMIADDPEAKKAKVATPVKNSVNVSSAASSSASSAASKSDGWRTINGVKYFYYHNNPLKGWQTIEGKKYYFDSKGALKTRLGVDVSAWQGKINWQKVKAAGVDFAIIRIGARGWGTAGNYYKDSCFEANYAGAKAAGISVGVYFFSQAITVGEAEAEAQFTLDILNGRSLTEPIAFDTENPPDDEARTKLANLTNQQRTDMAIAFCKKIKSAGRTPMVYSGKYWFCNYMNPAQLAPYTTWVAQYLDDPNIGTTYPYSYKYWQYTSGGHINGISTSADMNISF
jgi:GH25 family lysozyme M1 (1,4-beta-N-acetylmuramidase)